MKKVLILSAALFLAAGCDFNSNLFQQQKLGYQNQAAVPSTTFVKITPSTSTYALNESAGIDWNFANAPQGAKVALLLKPKSETIFKDGWPKGVINDALPIKGNLAFSFDLFNKPGESYFIEADLYTGKDFYCDSNPNLSTDCKNQNSRTVIATTNTPQFTIMEQIKTTISSIEPASITLKSKVTIHGSGFSPDNSVFLWGTTPDGKPTEAIISAKSTDGSTIEFETPDKMEIDSAHCSTCTTQTVKTNTGSYKIRVISDYDRQGSNILDFGIK